MDNPFQTLKVFKNLQGIFRRQKKSAAPAALLILPIPKGRKTIYFVAETKSEDEQLRPGEKQKIKCGTAHFKKFDDVVYKQVSKMKDLSA